MKLVLVSLQKFGGGAIDSLSLSNGLCENKFFHYLFIAEGNELIDYFENNEFRKIIIIKTFKSKLIDFLIQTILLIRPLIFVKKIIEIKPNIIQVTHFHPWVFFVYLLRPFLKYKVLYTPHDNPFEPKEETFPFMNFLEKIFVKKADLIIVHSNYVKNSLTEYCKKEMEVIYLGLYPKFFEIKEKDYFKENLCLLFWGRIEEYKGIDILIDAYEILKNKGYKIDLIIAGKGFLKEELKEKIKTLGIELKNYWLKNEEIEELLNKADILVAPYKKATQSGIAIFSLLYQIPIVATSVGAFPEYIDDNFNGLLVPPNDFQSLAEKIEILHKDRNFLKQLSLNAKEKAKEFEYKHLVKKLIKIYEKLSS
jgi:glycosyltransferase involved in cell wall biosynthesis